MNNTNIFDSNYLIDIFLNDINNISYIVKNYMIDDSVISSKLFCKKEPTLITNYIVTFLIIITKSLFLYMGYKLIKSIFYKYENKNISEDIESDNSANEDENDDNFKETGSYKCNIFSYILKLIIIYFLIKWYQVYLYIFNIKIL
jgi:Ca2+/Na+ antiporter